MAQQHKIQWDAGLPPFAGPGSEFPPSGYAIEAMAEGTNLGNPESILEIVKSLLSDGSLAVLEGWDNRVAPIRLRVSAPTAIAGPALADAEKALMKAVLATPKAPLVWVPFAQDSATCVFDVVAAELTRDTSDGWDLEESQRGYRYYLLTLTCLPFVRAETPVVLDGQMANEPHAYIDFEVTGSAPTNGSIRIAPESPGTLSNDMLIYTSTDMDWEPELRPMRVSSATVSNDASRRSGKKNNLSAPMVFRLPGSLPQGTYALMTIAWVQDAGTVACQAKVTSADGTAAVSSNLTTSLTTEVAATDPWVAVPLGHITLPPTRIDTPDVLAIELTLTGPSTMIVDEVYLFSTDNGSLTWYQGDNVALTAHWLEIDTATVSTPVTVTVGNYGPYGPQEQGGEWACGTIGTHDFRPGPMRLWVSRDGASTYMDYAITFPSRYHSHVEGSAVE